LIDPADLGAMLPILRRRLKVYLDPRTPLSKRSAEAWKIADAIALVIDEVERAQRLAGILDASR